MKKKLATLGFLLIALATFAQRFEEPKMKIEDFDSLHVKVGADFAMQYQGLKQTADNTPLVPLGYGINFPTANFNINGYLAPGIKVNLVTYLASRHHQDTWVKGGYLLVDALPSLNSDLINSIMQYTTIRVGVMEPNYGDAHLRRSDNGNVIRNPFVGNYIMDAFTTMPAAEIYFRNNGIIGMLAVGTGTLNQSLVGFNAATKAYIPYNVYDELAYYGKIGYDKQLNEDLRIRATLSGYHTANNHSGSLYNGDRAGSRYYLVMTPAKGLASDVDVTANPGTGNWGPGSTDKDNNVMLNLFTKFKGLEFFGTYEKIGGTKAGTGDLFDMSQYAGELIYRFGKDEMFYGGARYNMVYNNRWGDPMYTNAKTDRLGGGYVNGKSIGRSQVSAGWFITKNVLVKAEYVFQRYNKFPVYGNNATFHGGMVEAAISF